MQQNILLFSKNIIKIKTVDNGFFRFYCFPKSPPPPPPPTYKMLMTTVKTEYFLLIFYFICSVKIHKHVNV